MHMTRYNEYGQLKMVGLWYMDADLSAPAEEHRIDGDTRVVALDALGFMFIFMYIVPHRNIQLSPNLCVHLSEARFPLCYSLSVYAIHSVHLYVSPIGPHLIYHILPLSS